MWVVVVPLTFLTRAPSTSYQCLHPLRLVVRSVHVVLVRDLQEVQSVPPRARATCLHPQLGSVQSRVVVFLNRSR